MEEFEALRLRLRQLRKIHELTQEEVAELASIDAKYYQDLELGRRDNPGLSVLINLAKVYAIRVYQLLSPELPKTKIGNSIMGEPKTKYFSQQPRKRKSK